VKKEKAPYKTRKELIVDLESKVGGLMSANTLIQQAFVKTHQLMENRWEAMAKEIQELNYINRAMLAVGVFDQSKVDSKANEFKLMDFTKYLLEENLAGGYTDTDGAVTATAVVVVGTTCEDKALEIFRARLVVEKIQEKGFQEALIGKKAGDVFEFQLRGALQSITVYAVYEKQQSTGETDGQKQTSAA
jgi:hypothetical protein